MDYLGQCRLPSVEFVSADTCCSCYANSRRLIRSEHMACERWPPRGPLMLLAAQSQCPSHCRYDSDRVLVS